MLLISASQPHLQSSPMKVNNHYSYREPKSACHWLRQCWYIPNNIPWRAHAHVWSQFSLLSCQSVWLDIVGPPQSQFPRPLQTLLLPKIGFYAQRSLCEHYSNGCLLLLDSFSQHWCQPMCPRFTAIADTDSLPDTITCSCLYSWELEHGPVSLNFPDLTQYTVDVLSEVGVKIVFPSSFFLMLGFWRLLF